MHDSGDLILDGITYLPHNTDMTSYSRKPSTDRSITATEAAKNFGQLVDRVRESNSVYTIERGGVPVAQIGPVTRLHCTVADLVAALRSTAHRLPEEYLAAVDANVKAVNRPAIPRDPWAR
jgi:antitoxin (DNA-binding transcriptional repressor) of toxin-antitoxin stability system